MKRILIITDSLGAPRFVDGEKITYNDTWVCQFNTLLRTLNIETISMTINGLDSTRILQLTHDKLLLYAPDIVIFQFGIVDCAPRVLTNNEILILSFLRLSKITKKIISKHHAFLSNLRNLQHTGAKKFEINLEQIYTLFHSKGIKVIHLPIAPACQRYQQKSPKISYRIQQYNSIIEKNSDLLLKNLYDNADVEAIFLNDLHHLNIHGHQVVFDYLSKNLHKILV